MKVAILGANGVFGRHLTPRLTAAGHEVRALVRRPETGAILRAGGAELRQADIYDAGSLEAALAGSDLCINLATAVPGGPSGRGSPAANDRLRREGVPLLVEACRQTGTGRLLQQGICWVGAAGETLADESHRFEAVGDGPGMASIRAAQAMEETVRASGLDWAILRGGLFYGPGTGADDGWFAQARAGELVVPGDGSDFATFVHIADMAAATAAAVERWPSRQALIVADDMPVRWRDLFGHVAALAGAEPPRTCGPVRFPAFRMSNGLAKETLGWAPRYPDYRAGLAR
jgi:nucleoside-diphosphate-sugar epimerase